MSEELKRELPYMIWAAWTDDGVLAHYPANGAAPANAVKYTRAQPDPEVLIEALKIIHAYSSPYHDDTGTAIDRVYVTANKALRQYEDAGR